MVSIKVVLPMHRSCLNVSLTTHMKMNECIVRGWFQKRSRTLEHVFFLVGGLNRTQKHSRKSKIGSSSVSG